MIPLVLAQAADLSTALLLPVGSELNPIGALLLSSWPLAVLGKVALIVLVATAARLNPRLHLVALGALVGIAGAISNVRALG